MVFPVIDVKPNRKAYPLNPWMTQGILRSRKHKDKLGSKKLKNPTIENVLAYKTFNSLYNKIIRLAKIKYFDNKFKENARNIKRTWDTVREALGTRRRKLGIPNFFLGWVTLI